MAVPGAVAGTHMAVPGAVAGTHMAVRGRRNHRSSHRGKYRLFEAAKAHISSQGSYMQQAAATMHRDQQRTGWAC
jgi:hypothetical protein